MPDFQLDPPDFSFGYRAPRFFDDTLKLDPSLMPPPIGWYAQPRFSFSPVLLGPWYGNLDDALSPYMTSLSQLTAAQPNQPISQVLPKAMAGASTDSDLMDAIRDAVSDAAQDKFWQKIPATAGSLDPSGKPYYDGPLKLDPSGTIGDNLPGTGLKSTWLLPPWSLGKRFPFATGNDVYFKLYIDKDAIDGNRPQALISGGSLIIEGKSSDGLKRSLTIVGGRNQTGGPTGAILFEAKFW